MLAVVNLQCEVSGVVTPSTELLVNHEVNIPAMRSAEVLMQEIIKYINEHGSPITVSTDGDSHEPEALYNILTQEIMSNRIGEDLLEFEISCNSPVKVICAHNEKGPSQKCLRDTISMESREHCHNNGDVIGCLRCLRFASMKTFNNLSTHFLEYMYMEFPAILIVLTLTLPWCYKNIILSSFMVQKTVMYHTSLEWSTESK